MKHILRFVLALSLLGAIFGLAVWAWGWARFTSDFWPPDKATVGPNLVAAVIQALVVLIFAAIFWPPFREAVNTWVHGHLAKHNAELHKKLNHIIEHHPDIPPLD